VAQKAYFGLSYLVSLIIAIFPVSSNICGILVRFQREQYLFAILAIIPLFWPIFWIVDFVSMISKKDLEWLA
jgi:hypothetical protein